MTIKALSLWQPWATFIAAGHKGVETRHWSANHRGTLAIHAAQRVGKGEHVDWCRGVLGATGALPRGAVVAVARLAGVEVMPKLDVEEMRAWGRERAEALGGTFGDLELALGDWRPGRFAWFLAEVEALEEPFTVTGRQGIFGVPDPRTRRTNG